ncbi:MAG: hypothetical protein WCP21_22790 [Armatimonadota bacterium]
MICILLSIPLALLGLCTVAAVVGSARHDRLTQRPVPPAAAGETEAEKPIRLCA